MFRLKSNANIRKIMEVIWRGVLKIVLGFPLAYMKRAFQNVFPPLFPLSFGSLDFFRYLCGKFNIRLNCNLHS